MLDELLVLPRFTKKTRTLFREFPLPRYNSFFIIGEHHQPSFLVGIYATLFPQRSSLSIVGPFGLSGSLFLGLLVFDFYHPTNRDLYSPKESSLKNSPRGPIGRVLSLPCIICWKIFSPRRSMKNRFLFPKGEFLKELSEGSHW